MVVSSANLHTNGNHPESIELRTVSTEMRADEENTHEDFPLVEDSLPEPEAHNGTYVLE